MLLTMLQILMTFVTVAVLCESISAGNSFGNFVAIVGDVN